MYYQTYQCPASPHSSSSSLNYSHISQQHATMHSAAHHKHTSLSVPHHEWCWWTDEREFWWWFAEEGVVHRWLRVVKVSWCCDDKLLKMESGDALHLKQLTITTSAHLNHQRQLNSQSSPLSLISSASAVFIHRPSPLIFSISSAQNTFNRSPLKYI